MIVVGNTLAKVKTPEEQEDQRETQATEASPAEPRVMSDIAIPQLGDTTASLTIAWGDDKLYYRFSLKPESKKLREGRYRPFLNSPSFTLIFYDTAGFKEFARSNSSTAEIRSDANEPRSLG